MSKKYYLAIAIMALIITTAGVSLSADASERQVNRGDKPELTEEMKANFEEFKTLKESGDIEGAKALAEELGHPFSKGKKHKRGGNEEMKVAMEAGDYQAWVTAHEDAGRTEVSEKINEETFNSMIEVHTLKQSGDIEGAKALAEELGLEHFGMKLSVNLSSPRKGHGGGRGDCSIQE